MHLPPGQTRCVMRILARIGHDDPCGYRHHRFVQHAPAGVGDQVHAKGFQYRNIAIGPRLLLDGAAQGEHGLGAGVALAALQQAGQRVTLGRREMRIAQRHQIHCGLGRTAQLAPGMLQVLQADVEALQRRFAAQRCGGVRRLGRGANNMEHGRGAAGGKGGPKGLQVVTAERCVLQSAEHRYLGAAEQTDVVAQQGVVGIVRARRGGYFDAQRGIALVTQVATRFGCAAGQGNADV